MGARIGKQDQQLPQPANGLGTLSSHARFIPGCYLGGMGNSHRAPSHPCVLQPQPSPGSWCGLPSPCTEDSHLFCSIHPFLQAWNSYRGLVQERQLCPPWSSPPPALCGSGSLPVVGEKPCDHCSWQLRWAGLALHLFWLNKVLGAPGPARVIGKVNDRPLSPSPGGHSPRELVQHPQMTGKGRVIVSAMSTKQDGGRV